MNEDVQKVSIEYSDDKNKFIIILNGDIFHFSPQQYMEFVNHSIVAINSIIAERFANSLKNFMKNGKPEDPGIPYKSKKKTFTKKDSVLIADEVENWFKEHLNG